jgi:hypothetical protein
MNINKYQLGFGTLFITILGYTTYKYYMNGKNKKDKSLIIPDHILIEMRSQLGISDQDSKSDQVKLVE